MRYAVYTREGYDYGTPYGVYEMKDRAVEVASWLAELGNICFIIGVED